MIVHLNIWRGGIPLHALNENWRCGLSKCIRWYFLAEPVNVYDGGLNCAVFSFNEQRELKHNLPN